MKAELQRRRHVKLNVMQSAGERLKVWQSSSLTQAL